MDLIAIALFFALVARFVLRAWKAQGKLAGRDRWALMTSFAVAVTMFVAAPLVINWVLVPTVIWLMAVTVLAAGVVGAVLRWPDLAWHTGMHPLRRAIGIGTTIVSCALIIGLTVL